MTVEAEHKKPSQTARILKLLKERGESTNVELNDICYRYSSRILELRREGHSILSERIRPGVWRYTYKGQRGDVPRSTCDGCGVSFVPTGGRLDAKYCSHNCYSQNQPSAGQYSDVVARIMYRIVLNDSGCWVCSYAPDRNGYSSVRYQGSMRYTHRVIYERLVGPIPVGMQLDHLCKERGCVNPMHLEPVSAEENRRRSLGTAPAIAARKAATHCKNGHEYTFENTLLYRNARRCKTCQYASNALGRSRRRA